MASTLKLRLQFWYPYPLDITTCQAQVPYLGFVKRSGCMLGEQWGRKDFNPATGHPVYACGNGTVENIFPDAFETVLVLKHALLTGDEVYSTYAGVNTSVTVGQEVSEGEAVGVVQGESIYFAITTAPWVPGGKRFLKKLRWDDLGAHQSPSLFIDLRRAFIDLPLTKGQWTSFQVNASINIEMAYISQSDEKLIALRNSGGRTIENYLKLTDLLGTWEVFVDDDTLPGFVTGNTYELKALDDGVAFHAYVPRYERVDQIALADMIKWAKINEQVFPFLIGKTFRKAPADTMDGHDAWQIKLKVAPKYVEYYGKKLSDFIAVKPGNALIRYQGLLFPNSTEPSWNYVKPDYSWLPD